MFVLLFQVQVFGSFSTGLYLPTRYAVLLSKCWWIPTPHTNPPSRNPEPGFLEKLEPYQSVCVGVGVGVGVCGGVLVEGECVCVSLHVHLCACVCVWGRGG